MGDGKERSLNPKNDWDERRCEVGWRWGFLLVWCWRCSLRLIVILLVLFERRGMIGMRGISRAVTGDKWYRVGSKVESGP